MRIVSFIGITAAATCAVGFASRANAATTTCSTVAACAMYVNTTAGAGIRGYSQHGTGVVGVSFVSDSKTLNLGVHGMDRSGAGAGVLGDGNVGVVGRGIAAGVYGEAKGNGNAQQGYGVVGLGLGGVEGFANGNLPGVIGISTSSTQSNAFGILAFDLGGTGLLSSGNTGIVAQAFAASKAGATPPTALQLEAMSPGITTTLLRGLDATGKSVASLDSNGDLLLAGALVQHGAPLAAMGASDGTNVLVYGPRATQPSMEDVGEAHLARGTAFVPFERAFASTIDAHQPYLVFVTPEGDSRGLYVSERRPDGFAVRENGGGVSTVAFEYRIVAQPFDRPQTQARTQRMLSHVGGAAYSLHHPDMPNVPSVPALTGTSTVERSGG